MTPMKRRSFLKSSLALSALSFLTSNLDAFNELKPSLAEPVTPLRPARLVKGDTIAIMGMAGALRDPNIVGGFKEIIEKQGFTPTCQNIYFE